MPEFSRFINTFFAHKQTLFIATLIINIPISFRLLIKRNCWYHYNAYKIIAEDYRKIGRKKDTVLVHGETRYYNDLDVVPKLKYFYTPSLPYDSFPYAVEAQRDSIIRCENDVVILFYENEDSLNRKAPYLGDEKDAQVMTVLEQKYDLTTEVKDRYCVQMWVKKQK